MGQSKLKSCKCGVDCGQLVNIGVLAQHTSELRTGIPYFTGSEPPLSLAQLHAHAQVQNNFHFYVPQCCLWFNLPAAEINDALYPLGGSKKLHAIALGFLPGYQETLNVATASVLQAAAKIAMCWFPAPGSAEETAIDTFLADGGTVIINLDIPEFYDTAATPGGKAQLRPSVTAKVTQANTWFAHVGADTRVVYNEDLHTFDTLKHAHGLQYKYFRPQYPPNGIHIWNPDTWVGSDAHMVNLRDYSVAVLGRDFWQRNPGGSVPYTYAAPWDWTSKVHPVSANATHQAIGNQPRHSAHSPNGIIGIHNHDYAGTYLERHIYRKFAWDNAAQYPGGTHFSYVITDVFPVRYMFQHMTTRLFEYENHVYEIPSIIAEKIATGPGAGGKLFITHCKYNFPSYIDFGGLPGYPSAGVGFVKRMLSGQCRVPSEHLGFRSGTQDEGTDTTSGDYFSVRDGDTSHSHRYCIPFNPGATTSNNNTTGMRKVFPQRVGGITSIFSGADNTLEFRTDNAGGGDGATQHVLMALFHGDPVFPTNVLGGVGAELNTHSLTRALTQGVITHEFRVPLAHADIADFITESLVRNNGTSGNGTHYALTAIASPDLSGWQNATDTKNTGVFTYALIQRVSPNTPNGGILTLFRTGFPNVDVPIVVRPIVYQDGKYLLGVNGEYKRTKAPINTGFTQRDGYVLQQSVSGWRDVTNWPTLGGLVDLQFGPTAPIMSVGLAAIADVDWGMNTGDTATTRYNFSTAEVELDFAISFPGSQQTAIHSKSYAVP